MKKVLFMIAALTTLVSVLILNANSICATYSNYHWNTLSVSYNSEAYIPSSWQTPIANAAATWSEPTDFYLYRSYYSTNYVNSYDYGDTGWNAQVTWYASGYHLTQCITNFNTYYTDYDIETVALHEFGHWLRLLDVGDTDTVMWWVYNGTNRDLYQYDIDDINLIY